MNEKTGCACLKVEYRPIDSGKDDGSIVARWVCIVCDRAFVPDGSFQEKMSALIDAWATHGRPKVICICGSTRFADHHAIMRWTFEKEGMICLMINYLPKWYADEQGWNGNDHYGEQSGLKEHLDELHLRKIDLCDEVFIINVGGYIGESTRNEIEYAKSKDKPINYLITVIKEENNDVQKKTGHS